MRCFKIGDRVMYVGDKYDFYYAKSLTVRKITSDGISCEFEEQERPGGFGITTWLNAEDLLPEQL